MPLDQHADRPGRRRPARSAWLGLAVATGLLAGCAATSAPGTAAAGPSSDASSTESSADPGPTAAPTASVTSDYALCAEFPAVSTSAPGDLEGWWSSAPANADGSIIQDPDDWPDPRLREHPRVALVAVASGDVISTWDRATCTSGVPYTPVRTDAWPTAAEADTVILDMDTGEVLGTWSDPG